MRAVILAGGKGRRLAPYTTSFPKPLMPVGTMPILEVVLRQLEHHGFRRITLAVGHLAELIRAYCTDGQRWKVSLDYSQEETPLGTAGPLGMIDDLGQEKDFLVMNGDILTDLNYSALLDAHRHSAAVATVACHTKEVRVDLGVLDLSPDGLIVEYREKPILNFNVSMGIYVFRPAVLDFIEKGVPLDLPALIQRLIAARLPIHTYRFGGLWLDIGRPEDYEMAEQEFERAAQDFLP